MKCWVELGDGRQLNLPAVTRWKFSYGTGLPCDSFEVRCLWEGDVPTVLSRAALFYASWQGERIFTGVVDEFSCVCGEDGLYLELSGRSMAARLLDNEAMPVQYRRAACADIVARHVTPYGVEVVGGGDLPVVPGFSVDSGVSEWSVVWDYACWHGGIVPRFDRMGRLVLDGHRDDKVLEIGDSAPVTGWEYRDQRHGVLSSVAVRRRTDWGVQWVVDREFSAQGGSARRVITVPNETGAKAMRYSADYQLRASRSERVQLTVALAGAFLAWPGQLVDVKRSGLGGGRYRVAQAEVECSEAGLSTVLTLGLPDAMI